MSRRRSGGRRPRRRWTKSLRRVARAAAAQHGPGIHPEPRPAAGGSGYARWLRTNVRPQKQEDYVSAVVTVPLGDLSGEQYRILGQLASAYGDGSVRVTAVQDVVFRWVRRAVLPDLYARLEAAGLGLGDADTIADVTSCPGAESCKLAVTQSRGLGQALEQHLRATPALIDLAPDLDIKISGCPNGCGQHHIATIGFQGSLRKVGGRAVPQYFIQVGGGIDADGTTFGRLAAKVPARRAPEALERLVAALRGNAAARPVAGGVLPHPRSAEGEGAARRSRGADARFGQRHRLHRSRRDHRVPAQHHRGRVRGVTDARTAASG